MDARVRHPPGESYSASPAADSRGRGTNRACRQRKSVTASTDAVPADARHSRARRSTWQLSDHSFDAQTLDVIERRFARRRSAGVVARCGTPSSSARAYRRAAEASERAKADRRADDLSARVHSSSGLATTSVVALGLH